MSESDVHRSNLFALIHTASCSQTSQLHSTMTHLTEELECEEKLPVRTALRSTSFAAIFRANSRLDLKATIHTIPLENSNLTLERQLHQGCLWLFGSALQILRSQEWLPPQAQWNPSQFQNPANAR